MSNSIRFYSTQSQKHKNLSKVDVLNIHPEEAAFYCKKPPRSLVARKQPGPGFKISQDSPFRRKKKKNSARDFKLKQMFSYNFKRLRAL